MCIKNKNNTISPFLSIIVPVYNNENFLKLCIESILNQSFTNFELILINDGSNDKSDSICKNYLYDSRVIYIYQKNKGMGVSYNHGLNLAKGQYVGFVESDDYINRNMYKILIDEAKKNYFPDVVKCTYYEFTDINKKIKDKFIKTVNINKILNNPLDAPEFYLGHPSHWSAIYKTEFLNKNSIKFNNTPGAACQDAGFSFLVYVYMRSFVLIKCPLYYYRVDNFQSSQNSNFSFACLQNMNERFYISNLFKERNIEKEFKEVEALKIYNGFKHYYRKGVKEKVSYMSLISFLKLNSKLFRRYSSIKFSLFKPKDKLEFKLIKYVPFIYFLIRQIFINNIFIKKIWRGK